MSVTIVLTFQVYPSKCIPVRIKVSEKSPNIPFPVTRTDLVWVSLRLSRKNQGHVVRMPTKKNTHTTTQTVGLNISFGLIFNKVKLITSLQAYEHS